MEPYGDDYERDDKKVGAFTFKGACMGEGFDRGAEDGIKKMRLKVKVKAFGMMSAGAILCSDERFKPVW